MDGQPMTRLQGNVLIAVNALLLMGLAGFWMRQELKPKPALPQWEYQVITVSNGGPARTETDAFKFATINVDPKQLAEMGAAGWELAGTFLEMETAFPNFGNAEYVTGLQPNVRPQRLVLIFKRPIQPS